MLFLYGHTTTTRRARREGGGREWEIGRGE